jgi:hypothetical protein
MSKTQRILYRTIATHPRQFAISYLAGLALSLLITVVLNGAFWVALVSCFALGFVLAHLFPKPSEVRRRLRAPSIPSESRS